MTQTILLTILCTSGFYMLIWFVIGFASDFDSYQVGGGIFVSFGAMVIISLIALNFIDSKFEPMAIDVYRGNTTLEITYKDSIPIDSIVVWK
jgi:hypothetical protein